MKGDRWQGYLDASNGLYRPESVTDREAYLDGWHWWHQFNR